MKIEYLDDTHQYLIDGILVPSVSVLVDFAMGGNSYIGVNEFILNKAREYGNEIHEAIEDFERTGNVQFKHGDIIETYKKLKSKYLLDVKDMEQIVHYKKHFCGRYDIMSTDGYLWDIKTTSKPYKDKWSWQLGFYQLAAGMDNDIAYVLYMPKKGIAKVYAITPKTKEECIEVIERYEEHKKSKNEDAPDTTESETTSVAETKGKVSRKRKTDN